VISEHDEIDVVVKHVSSVFVVLAKDGRVVVVVVVTFFCVALSVESH